MEKKENEAHENIEELKDNKKNLSPANKHEGKPERSEPSDIPDFLEDAPPQMRRVMMGLMQASVGGRLSHPVFEKFNEEHIHKYLDYIQRDDDNEFKLKTSSRWFSLAYVIFGLSVFVFLVVFLLPNEKALLVDIFKILAAFLGGLGSGYGLKASLDKKKQL
jgi:hypothetical protein